MMRRHHDGMMMAGMIWWASREAFVTERGEACPEAPKRIGYMGVFILNMWVFE